MKQWRPSTSENQETIIWPLIDSYLPVKYWDLSIKKNYKFAVIGHYSKQTIRIGSAPKVQGGWGGSPSFPPLFISVWCSFDYILLFENQWFNTSLFENHFKFNLQNQQALIEPYCSTLIRPLCLKLKYSIFYFLTWQALHSYCQGWQICCGARGMRHPKTPRVWASSLSHKPCLKFQRHQIFEIGQ